MEFARKKRRFHQNLCRQLPRAPCGALSLIARTIAAASKQMRNRPLRASISHFPGCDRRNMSRQARAARFPKHVDCLLRYFTRGNPKRGAGIEQKRLLHRDFLERPLSIRSAVLSRLASMASNSSGSSAGFVRSPRVDREGAFHAADKGMLVSPSGCRWGSQIRAAIRHSHAARGAAAHKNTSFVPSKSTRSVQYPASSQAFAWACV